MSNWGIDNWICETYFHFGSCFKNRNILMENNAENSSERYQIDYNFRKTLYIELNSSISIIKKYLQSKSISI